MASWEAAFLPDWTWEAYDKEEDGLYFGRMKSPGTHWAWEYGYFTREQLKEAGAYRTDLEPGGDRLMYPDGGVPIEDLVRVYETELEALNNSNEEKGWFEE